jgi:hypothetical protein
VCRTLFGLSHRRTAVEAVGCYLAYLAAGLLLNVAVGQVMGLFVYDPGADYGLGIAVHVSGYNATAILRSRRLWASPVNVVLWLLSFVGAVYGGLALGLVFPVNLSTRPDGPAKRGTLTLA